MTPQQAVDKCLELQRQVEILHQQYVGELSLYTAACLSGDTKLADEHRVRAIQAIEKMLDNLGTSATLTRYTRENMRR